VITVWAGLLVGAQVRYLISSANGWLGGFGCSAAALNLRDRDTWIGWDAETPRAQLRCVVCMSRFLLRPRGCRRLASKVLGRVLRRVAEFRTRLRLPFCPAGKFRRCVGVRRGMRSGRQLSRVGQTQRRGRQDRDHQHNAGLKAIMSTPWWRTFAPGWAWCAFHAIRPPVPG
jgi:hypothetical protein